MSLISGHVLSDRGTMVSLILCKKILGLLMEAEVLIGNRKKRVARERRSIVLPIYPDPIPPYYFSLVVHDSNLIKRKPLLDPFSRHADQTRLPATRKRTRAASPPRSASGVPKLLSNGCANSSCPLGYDYTSAYRANPLACFRGPPLPLPPGRFAYFAHRWLDGRGKGC